MKKRFLTVISVVIVLTMAFAGTVSASGGKFDETTGGGGTTFAQTIPVNVVFIGYNVGLNLNQVKQADFMSQLPASYTPVVRYPQFYGLNGRYMGLQYNYQYNWIVKDATFTNNFFNYLKSIRQEGGLTVFQQYYNDQLTNIKNVTGPVYYLDAPSVERWLNTNLGLPANSYTIVYINWYKRPDFKFHVYTKTNEPDPDTGYNFGAVRASRKMIAWGGSYSRLWFYDLSAGPESWSGNWNVDNSDLDGDGYADYRMPPIWEYGSYRGVNQLSKDLGRVARYVALNLLFTSSPLYDPLNTAPGLNGKKIVHINMMEDDPASTGSDWIQPDFVTLRYKNFQPYYAWDTNMTTVDPIDANAQKSFRIWAGLDNSSDCWNAWGTPFAQLWCYFDTNYSTYFPAYGAKDYVIPINAFNTTDANMGGESGLLGYADDNWVDGTQSMVFQFDTDYYRSLGYGFTSTTVHEGGHHLGMSHPHDGYDSTRDIDYSASGPFYFVWSGDESHTVMQYISVTNQFGRFDKDNYYRWEFAGYLNWSYQLLAALQAHPNYASVSSLVSSYQTYEAAAKSNFNAWNYYGAASNARKAYQKLLHAAALLGVPTPDMAAAQAIQGSNANFEREGDPIRFPDN